MPISWWILTLVWRFKECLYHTRSPPSSFQTLTPLPQIITDLFYVKKKVWHEEQWLCGGPIFKAIKTSPVKKIKLVQVFKSKRHRLQSFPGGGTLAILCVLGMCRPQGYGFYNFCLGRVLVSAQQSGKGTFFTVSVCEEFCFQAQQSGKGCFDPGFIRKCWQDL